jgi:phenylalanyl-tRNA synthetase alpha chain
MTLKDEALSLQAEVAAYAIAGVADLEAFRLAYISKNGKLSRLFEQFKNVPKEDKKEFGQILNAVKQAAEEKFRLHKEKIEAQSEAAAGAAIDVTLPADLGLKGSLHPLTQTKDEIIRIFQRMGFNLSEGPEIETDWHNFSALNFAPNHPARDMQDTFFVEKNPDLLLRTHTSSVQIRVMESQKPPIRTLSVGRVFRNETISARAHCMFHQIEGLYVDKNVSFADLKETLFYFAKEFFGTQTKIRLRPSYFPFTEPSAEVDVSCNICNQKGCNVCKYTGWLEVLGCGMVHPNVLRNCGIDPDIYSGFAFGMGIERIAMMRYTIKDLRLYFENDMRFLKQF